MYANISRYYFKIQANIYKLWQLPRNKPSHQYRIIYNNTPKCVQQSRSIKNICFFVIAGLLELLTAYVRPVNTRPAIREVGINFKSKEIQRDNQRGGTIRESGTIRDNKVEQMCPLSFLFNFDNFLKDFCGSTDFHGQFSKICCLSVSIDV